MTAALRRLPLLRGDTGHDTCHDIGRDNIPDALGHSAVRELLRLGKPAPRAVRLSLTDRCDLACIYCRPHKNDGYLSDRLDTQAWLTMVEGLMAAGVRRVRITGGEPLLHREILPIIEGLARLRLEDLALTTNATRLAKLAQPLRRAGLHRLNISLDSLDPQTFHRMTRGGDLHLVLEGIEAALSAGFVGTKLNAVVVRGENDHELETLVHYCWDRGITPRFLEVMMIGEGAKMRDRVVSGTEIRARLAHLLEQDVAVADPHRGPAKYVSSRHDQRLRVGFITGTTDTYCDTCDRMRVGADGFLRPCLAKGDGVSAAFAARTGNVSSVAHTVHEAWSLKPDGQTFKGCTEKSAADLSIRAIGG